jgi:hypothetical protein
MGLPVEELRRFQKTCEVSERHSAVGVTIFHRAHLAAELASQPRAAKVIAIWLGQLQDVHRGKGPVCLGCCREFGPTFEPEAFCIAEPCYQAAPREMVCFGICRACSNIADDELRMILGKIILGESAQAVDEGRA